MHVSSPEKSFVISINPETIPNSNKIKISGCFQPMLILLKIFGLTSISKKTSKYFALELFYQVSFVSIFYFSIGLAAYIAFFKNSISGLSSLSEVLSYAGYYAASIINYTTLLVKRKSLQDFIHKLSIQQTVLNSPRKFSILVYLTVLVPCVISGIDGKYTSPWSSDQFVNLMSSLWAIVVNPCMFFSMSTSLFFCYVINSVFDDFKKFVKQNSYQSTTYFNVKTRIPNVKFYIEQHRNLCELVRNFEEIYSVLYLVWCACDLTLVVFSIRAVNLTDDVSRWKLTLLVPVVQVILVYIVKILAAAQVNSQTNTELSLYFQQVSANPDVLTAGKFFVITKNTLLSAGTTLLTYILVLYDAEDKNSH